jgi:fibronectin type 3 domain-containing protein
MNSATNWMRIFDFGTGTNAYMFLTPANGSTGNVRFSITTNGYSNEQQINSSVAVATGTWTHIAVTLSGSLGTLYVNGTAVGTNSAMTLNPSSLGNTTNNYIGQSQFSGDPYLDGLVDEFHIYSQALTPAQISSLMSGPAAPTSLTAAPGNNQVTLAWNTASGATSYNVERSTVSGGPYTMVSWYNTAANFTDTGLTNGVPYYYVVVSANSPVVGGISSEISATPFGAPSAPPTGLTAAPGNAQVALSWTAVTGASSYCVQRALTTNGAYAAIGTTTSAGYTDTGLTNGATYYYVVSSLNGSGTSANYSSEVSATPSTPISATEAAAPLMVLSESGANTNLALTVLSSVLGHTYQVQYSRNLSAGWWTNLGSPQPGAGANLTFNFVINPRSSPSGFYRILIQR